jgi:hypothetical protein
MSNNWSEVWNGILPSWAPKWTCILADLWLQDPKQRNQLIYTTPTKSIRMINMFCFKPLSLWLFWSNRYLIQLFLYYSICEHGSSFLLGMPRHGMFMFNFIRNFTFWISICRRLKLELSLSPCTSIISKWSKDLTVRSEML